MLFLSELPELDYQAGSRKDRQRYGTGALLSPLTLFPYYEESQKQE